MHLLETDFIYSHIDIIRVIDTETIEVEVRERRWLSPHKHKMKNIKWNRPSGKFPDGRFHFMFFLNTNLLQPDSTDHPGVVFELSIYPPVYPIFLSLISINYNLFELIIEKVGSS